MEAPPNASRLDLDGLLRHVDQRARILETIASQATISPPASGFDPTPMLDTSPSEGSDTSEFTTPQLDFLAAAMRWRERERDLEAWFQRVSAEAKVWHQQLCEERRALLDSSTAVGDTTISLSVLDDEAPTLVDASAAEPPDQNKERAAEAHRVVASPPTPAERKEGRVHSSLARAAHPSHILKLNVGGQVYCTTLETLLKEESMLSSMFSGRYEVEAEPDGVFIDRDGSMFRHVLNYLRGGEVFLGRDAVAHKALLAEADFYGLEGLRRMLLHSLKGLEDKGERLRKLSIDTVIADTCGTFDELLRLVYDEAERKALLGRRACSIAFVQEKRVKGLVYRSQEPGIIDRTVLDANFHRLLSNISTQQLICYRLAEDGLKAYIKPMSVNEQAGDQWVSTTTIVLTVSIWGEGDSTTEMSSSSLFGSELMQSSQAFIRLGVEPSIPSTNSQDELGSAFSRLHSRSIRTSVWSNASN